MKDKLNTLKTRLVEINDLRAAVALLDWDQQTYMPPGGSAARARQLATLSRIAHDEFTNPDIGKLLDDLQSYEESLPHDSDDASLIRVVRRDYEKATRVPASFVSEASNHFAASYSVWAEARPANDFAAVQPYLEKSLDLSRRYAAFFPDAEHIADPLIDLGDEGMTAAIVGRLFADLREQLVPIVHAITSQPPTDDTCLLQEFDKERQIAFGLEAARLIGYDLERGRQDEAPHPFSTGFSIGDVRITTRVRTNDLREALFSTLHEAGHAMYEQGIKPDLEGTPLAHGTSSGTHESQSRLWENVVGRSRGFWNYVYPRLQAAFPDQMASVPLEYFYRAINKVERSLIRVDADEVTYNLHVMLRFDLELALLEGRLAVRDLPEAWRERFEADFGIAPPDDRDGVMQDVHWYCDYVGGCFQGYTLGNILCAQFYAAALDAHPEIPAEIEQGRFDTLLNWLTENIYQHGRKFTAQELVQRATGNPLSIEPYIRYLRAKYGELYDL